MAQHGINKVILIGNLGNDPETRFFPDGGAVTNVSIATSESWKDKQTGEKKENTTWHRLVFRDRGNYKMAEYAAELGKGQKIYAEGRLVTRKWETQSGETRYATEVDVQEFQRLTANPDQQPKPQQAAGQAAGQAPAGNAGDFDDGIPFAQFERGQFA